SATAGNTRGAVAAGMPTDTRWSWGEDGGRGGRGGDAGDPTNGGNAGDGGQVIFEVGHLDTDLLALAERNIQPGTPGKKGRTARGGRGGEGGPGGSSYSWTESHTETYTDSNGKSQTRTRYTHHHNPGGSRGSRGSDGSSSSRSVHDGRPGEIGEFGIMVLDEAGQPIGHFDEIYDMELLSFDLVSRNADAIFEPGEEITVSNIRVRNAPGAGRMSTPETHSIQVYFQNRGYLMAAKTRLTIPKSLTPGEEYQFDQDLKLNIRDVEDYEIPEHGEAWTADQKVTPVAEMASVQQQFGNFENPMSIEIRFPIEVTPIHAAHSLGRGDSTKIFWKVKNVSGRTFGSLSDIKRAIATNLARTGGEVSADRLEFKDAQGRTVALDDGFLKSIENLGADETVMIEGKLQLSKDAPLYSEAELKLDLSLGRIDDGENRRRIQSRVFTVRVAQTYRKTKGSDMLLITNSSSKREEVAAWKRVAANLGMKVDVWDLSLNGFMDMSKDADRRNNLLKDFSGKTVVMLNNGFEVSVGKGAESERVRSEYFLSKKQFLNAAAAYDINFLAVGNAGTDDEGVLSRLLTPTREVDGASKDSEFSSSIVFLREVWERYLREDESGLKNVDYTDWADSVEVKANRWWFRKPKYEELEAEAAWTLNQLDQAFPLRRYIATPLFDARATGRRPWYWLGLKKEWSLGEIEFRRTLDRTLDVRNGTAVALAAGQGRMHEPAFIRSKEAYTALFLALSMQQKLKALGSIYGRDGRDMVAEERKAAGEAAVDAILSDLANEQAALRQHWWRHGLSRRNARAKLRALRYVMEEHDFGFGRELLGTEQGELMIRLAAGTAFLAKSQRLIRDYFLMFLPPFTRRNLRVSSITMGLVGRFVKRMFPRSDYEKTNTLKEARLKVKALVDEHKAETKAMAKTKEMAKRVVAMMRILSPLSAVTTDAELLMSLAERIVGEDRMDSLRRDDNRRERAKTDLEAGIKEAQKVLTE
ncbi:hypothetical protein ACFL2T_06325, partial [Elusimicrobiota bacterium]